jgi:putative phage-type endonuclease
MENVQIIPTWDMSEEEWLDARAGGIGGSDAGTVVGVNRYKSTYALWAEKSGLVERDFVGNDATRWGHRLERVVAEGYAEDYNKAVVEWPVILRSTVEGQEFMFANLDFLIVEPNDEFPAGKVQTWRFDYAPPGIQGILEIKTAGIASPGNPGAWANNQIPQSYMLQGYHYGIVTSINKITFAALVGGSGLQVREMQWEDEIAENLVIAESQFWSMVESKTAPEVDGSEATESAQQKRYPRHEAGKGVEGGSNLAAIWEEYNSAKAESDEADQRRKSLRAQILEIIGDAEYAMVDGKAICSFKASKEVETLDTDRLRAEAPEIWIAYKKTRPGSRTLRAIK